MTAGPDLPCLISEKPRIRNFRPKAIRADFSKSIRLNIVAQYARA